MQMTSEGIVGTEGLEGTIRRNTKVIRDVVSSCSTESVVGYWFVQNLRHGHRPPGLSSPAKQILYLMGYWLNRPKPTRGVSLATEIGL